MKPLPAVAIALLILALIALIVWAIVDSTRPENGEPTPTPTPVLSPTPTPEPTEPNAPSLLQAEAISSGSIRISWQDNSDNELKFDIERKRGAAGIFRRIASVGKDVANYRDSGLYETTTYYYRVRASNAVGTSDYSNDDSAQTLEPTQHVVGDTIVGSDLSVGVVSAGKTNRYCDYEMFVPRTWACEAPSGSSFVVVAVAVSNTSDSPVTVNRVDMRLRNYQRDITYGWYPYTVGDLGDPFPDSIKLRRGEAVAGVVLYLVPDSHPLSEMETLFIADDEVHVWRLQP